MKNYTATVAEESFDLSPDRLQGLDVVGPYHGVYHLIHGGKSYRCRLLQLDRTAKELTVEIGKRPFRVQLADEYDQLVQRMGLSAQPEAATNEITAPMPGLILEVLVGTGDAVEAGTPLLVLEAMKMENVIKADGAGTVKEIKVSKGEAVDKRQLLIEME